MWSVSHIAHGGGRRARRRAGRMLWGDSSWVLWALLCGNIALDPLSSFESPALTCLHPHLPASSSLAKYGDQHHAGELRQ